MLTFVSRTPLDVSFVLWLCRVGQEAMSTPRVKMKDNCLMPGTWKQSRAKVRIARVPIFKICGDVCDYQCCFICLLHICIYILCHVGQDSAGTFPILSKMIIPGWHAPQLVVMQCSSPSKSASQCRTSESNIPPKAIAIISPHRSREILQMRSASWELPSESSIQWNHVNGCHLRASPAQVMTWPVWATPSATSSWFDCTEGWDSYRTSL